jgi:hypothetical protein
MKKILFILLLLVPIFVFGQRKQDIIANKIYANYVKTIDSLRFEKAYGGTLYCDTVYAITHYAVSAFDTVQKVRKITTDTLVFRNKLLGTSDTILIVENNIAKYKILDMTPYLKFSDTTSLLLTQTTASNTYQLKYWSKTGTAIQPYISTDTVIAPYIRLKNIHTTGTVLTEVTSTGLLDTIRTKTIDSYFETNNLFIGRNKKTTVDSTKIITDTLIIHSVIKNKGVYNQDTVIVLADDAAFNFPTASVGWAEIQCDSSLIEKTWGYISWNGDGSTFLRSNGASFIASNTDGYNACFYDGGTYAILRNTSGYSKTYTIKLYYHY